MQSLGTPWVTVGAASTTLGVGVSATGAAGTFSASGTETWSSDATQGFPAEWYSYGSHHFETEFSEEEDRITCEDIHTGMYSYSYVNHVDGWVGGDEAVGVNSINAPYCAYEEPGNSDNTLYTANNTKAWTFTAGLSIPALGLNATAQTGYTNSASISFEFNANDNRRLCGAQGYPNGGTPSLLQVEPW